MNWIPVCFLLNGSVLGVRLARMRQAMVGFRYDYYRISDGARTASIVLGTPLLFLVAGAPLLQQGAVIFIGIELQHTPPAGADPFARDGDEAKDEFFESIGRGYVTPQNIATMQAYSKNTRNGMERGRLLKPLK